MFSDFGSAAWHAITPFAYTTCYYETNSGWSLFSPSMAFPSPISGQQVKSAGRWFSHAGSLLLPVYPHTFTYTQKKLYYTSLPPDAMPGMPAKLQHGMRQTCASMGTLMHDKNVWEAEKNHNFQLHRKTLTARQSRCCFTLMQALIHLISWSFNLCLPHLHHQY